MKNLVVITGAGISAESGIKTFRDTNGLWEEYRIEDVCTYDAWIKNPKLVLEFYNKRRKQLESVNFNKAHKLIAQLEKHFNIVIITQNVDNLHERAGSTNVLHLHGELTKVRSTTDNSLVYDISTKEIKLGDKCTKGSQLRPHIVWFGEDVPLFNKATQIVSKSDLLLIVGTSMVVFPAASLIHYCKKTNPIWYIDPNPNLVANNYPNLKIISEKATIGMEIIFQKLINLA